MNADAQVRAFFMKPLTRAESDASIDSFKTHQAEHGFSFWAIEEKATGAFAGLTGLKRTRFQAPFTPCIEIGWRLPVAFWGRGLASEAARASLRFGFQALKLNEIYSFAPHSNLRSQRVMERIGMIRAEGEDFILPGIPADHALQPFVLYRIANSGRAFHLSRNAKEEMTL